MCVLLLIASMTAEPKQADANARVAAILQSHEQRITSLQNEIAELELQLADTKKGLVGKAPSRPPKTGRPIVTFSTAVQKREAITSLQKTLESRKQQLKSALAGEIRFDGIPLDKMAVGQRGRLKLANTDVAGSEFVTARVLQVVGKKSALVMIQTVNQPSGQTSTPRVSRGVVEGSREAAEMLIERQELARLAPIARAVLPPTTLLVSGIDTTDLVDGAKINLTEEFEVIESKSYDSVTGPRKVRAIKVLDVSTMREDLEEAKRRYLESKPKEQKDSRPKKAGRAAD